MLLISSRRLLRIVPVQFLRDCTEHGVFGPVGTATCALYHRAVRLPRKISPAHLYAPSSCRPYASLAARPEPQTDPVHVSPRETSESQLDDKLYRMIELKVKGHDEAVINSYEWFLCKAAKELEIPVTRVYVPLLHYNRLSLLKSKFIYKKHWVQYEMRTYSRVVQLKYLTGSTADTYLEYVERNLPEGVAMKVLKCEIEEVPGHLHPAEQEPEESLERRQG